MEGLHVGHCLYVMARLGPAIHDFLHCSTVNNAWPARADHNAEVTDATILTPMRLQPLVRGEDKPAALSVVLGASAWAALEDCGAMVGPSTLYYRA